MFWVLFMYLFPPIYTHQERLKRAAVRRIEGRDCMFQASKLIKGNWKAKNIFKAF